MRRATGYCRSVFTRQRLVVALTALLAVSCSQIEPGADAVSDRLLITGDDRSVSIVDGEGVVIEQLAGPGGGGRPVQATSSPDGSAVVWTSGAAMELWADGEVTTIEPDFVPFFYLWAPDGSRILALGNDPVQPSVRAALIDLDGSVEVVVIDRPIYAQWLDPTRLVMHLGSRHVAVSDGGEPAIFGGGSPSYLAPDVLDGKVVMVGEAPGALTASIVEIPVQESGDAVVLMDLTGGPARTIIDVSNAVSFAVNPDQKRLAVLRGVRSSGFLVGDLIVVDVEEGRDDPHAGRTGRDVRMEQRRVEPADDAGRRRCPASSGSVGRRIGGRVPIVPPDTHADARVPAVLGPIRTIHLPVVPGWIGIRLSAERRRRRRRLRAAT